MSQSYSKENKRIAKNTLFLYIRSILVMVISLYTSRVVLNTLGVTDYGIYNVVGGLVVLFSSISATFSSSTQRFLSYEIGRKNGERLKDVFSVSLNIHFVLSIIIFVLIEIFGYWFLNNRMNIPSERLYAANWVLHCSMITLVVNLISVPYNAAIIANEKMNIFAYISILEVSLKLLIVYLLKIILFDKLILYALLMLSVSLLIRFVYGLYCGRTFQECKHQKVKDKSLYKEILGISGWNFLGSSASILTVEGMNLLLNLFGGGVVINAAKGIAAQIQNAVTQLINNFMTSLNPQITKSYASNDQDYMISLLNRGTRFSFYLMCMLSFPLILETRSILLLWLGNVPEYAVEFVQWTLFYLMVLPFSTLLNTIILASGNIRNSQIVLSILQFLNLPISFFILKLGCPPYYIFLSYISVSFISLIARLIFTHNRSVLSYSYYLFSVMYRSIIVLPIVIIITLSIIYFFPSTFIRLIIVSLVFEVLFLFNVYYLGLTKNERIFLNNKIVKFLFTKKG